MKMRNAIRRVLYVVLFLGLSAKKTLADDFTNFLSQGLWALHQHNYSIALADYANALNIKSNNASAYSGRASAYFGMHMYQQAESDYTATIQYSTDTVWLASAYYGRGDFYAQTTNTTKAIDDLSKAIQLDPALPGSYASRAEAWEQNGKYSFAIYDCNMAIMLDPNFALPYQLKGTADEMMQDYKRALDDFSKALEIDSNSVSIHASRAYVFYLQEDYKNAVSDFNRVIQLDPTNAEVAEIYSCRGLCLSQTGNFKDGIFDCQRAFEINAKSWITCNNLAWLLATAPQSKLRDGEKAVELATHACVLTSWQNAYALGTLAAAYAETGDFDKAVTWEKKCILLGLPEKEMHQAHVELNLFEQKKPYHAEK